MRAVVAFGGAMWHAATPSGTGNGSGLSLSQRCGSSHQLASSIPSLAVDSSFALSFAAV